MGDEEKVAEKKGGKKIIFLLLIVIILLIAGGAAGYFLLVKKKKPAPSAGAPPAASVPGTPAAGTAAPQYFYTLDTFIVNLADEGGTRYLKVDMTLALSNKEVEKEIEKKLPLIRDAIITVISNKYYQDIATPAGKLALKREIMARVNMLLTTGKVIDIFFTDFVVQ